MIEVRDVSKQFGTTVALDRISFRLDRGEVLGFLGPNGAGKSTTMKILTTFLAPDEGQVTVGGVDVLENPLAVRGQIGYLPEIVPLYADMNVDEYLRFVGEARGLAGQRLRERLGWCVEACGLETELKRPIQELSKGFRQRTGLAQALIHDPEILILDEPTSGLDPLQIIEIRELIHSLAGQKTIIFSTHILQEVQPITDRIVIINEGRIIADGHAGELTEQAMGANRLFVIVAEDAAVVEPALEALDEVSGLSRTDQQDGAARFEVRGDFTGDLSGAVARLSRERGWQVNELREGRYSLEDTFIALTKRSRASSKEVKSDA